MSYTHFYLSCQSDECFLQHGGPSAVGGAKLTQKAVLWMLRSLTKRMTWTIQYHVIHMPQVTYLYGDVWLICFQPNSLSVASISMCHYFLFVVTVVIIIYNSTLYNHSINFCLRLLERQRKAPMGKLLVGVLSGFTLASQAVTMGDLVRKAVTSPGKVSLYLDSVN